jgi:hypothetical protein
VIYRVGKPVGNDQGGHIGIPKPLVLLPPHDRIQIVPIWNGYDAVRLAQLADSATPAMTIVGSFSGTILALHESVLWKVDRKQTAARVLGEAPTQRVGEKGIRP